jgi:hypothetical protein
MYNYMGFEYDFTDEFIHDVMDVYGIHPTVLMEDLLDMYIENPKGLVTLPFKFPFGVATASLNWDEDDNPCLNIFIEREIK